MNDLPNRNLINIENLEKTYFSKGEELTILKDLFLTVEEQSNVVIRGESGSGKSTLLNIIAGLDLPTSGVVQCGKWNVPSLKESEQSEYRLHFLGLIFQFHYLLKDFTALENVFLPAVMSGVPKKIAIEKAKVLLSDVGLENRFNHLPSELSGGERQRASVARSLINEPSLILADEPTGNLDPQNANVVGDLLFSMVEKYKKTLLLVTHDSNLARRSSTRYKIVYGKLEKDV